MKSTSTSDLEDFFENAAVAMHLVAADGTIVRANKAELDLLGYTAEEYIGHHIAEYHVDRPTIDGILDRLTRGDTLDKVPAKLRTKDGAIKHVLISSSGQFRNGELVNTRCVTIDVTAQQPAFELAAIVDSSNDAIISKDLDGIITGWNPAAERLFGYTADEARGQPITMLMPADRVHEEARILERIRRGERVEHYETVRRRKDGSLVDISLTVSPVRDAEGTVIGASKIARDITNRKRSQASLIKRASEQAALYRLVDRLQRPHSLSDTYEAALDAIIEALGSSRASVLLFDEAGVMRFVAWRGLSERYRKAVEGHTPWRPGERDAQPILVEDIDRADEPDSVKAVIKEEGVRALAFIPLFAQGTVVGKFMAYWEAPRRFADSDAAVAIAIARQLDFDLERLRAEAARRTAEERLRRNEQRLLLATTTGKVGLWDWDIASDQVSWTDSLYAIHGVDETTFHATVEGFAALVHPDDRERVSQSIARALEHDEHYELEFRAVRPDGRIVWLFTNAIVVREDGKAVRMGGATVDITDRKEAEEQLRDKSAQLETVMATVPAAIWIAHDREAKRITGSRYAAEFLRLAPDANQSLSAPPDQRPAHFRLLKDGVELTPAELPVQRAAKGEEIRGEELQVIFADGTSRWEYVNASPIRDAAGNPIGAVGAAIDITKRREAEEHRKLLVGELNHRVKNTLAVVQGLAQQTFRGADVPAAARQAFEGRLAALASAHNLLTQRNWAKAYLHEIVDQAILVPGRTKERISLRGGPILLQPKQAESVAMAIHELCTNAMKYGALSNDTGVVTCEWSVANGPEPSFKLVWRERGGPTIKPPKSHGFGSRLIEQALAQALGGTVTREFAPQGLVCTIEAPVPEI